MKKYLGEMFLSLGFIGAVITIFMFLSIIAGLYMVMKSNQKGILKVKKTERITLTTIGVILILTGLFGCICWYIGAKESTNVLIDRTGDLLDRMQNDINN